MAQSSVVNLCLDVLGSQQPSDGEKREAVTAKFELSRAGQKGSDVSAREATRKVVSATRQLHALHQVTPDPQPPCMKHLEAVPFVVLYYNAAPTQVSEYTAVMTLSRKLLACLLACAPGLLHASCASSLSCPLSRKLSQQREWHLSDRAWGQKTLCHQVLTTKKNLQP